MQIVRTLTIRNVTPSLADALEAEKRRLGTSMNNTVLQLLRESLNVDKESGRRTNGLEKLAGGWTEEDFQEFERNTADQRVVDDEMWK